MTSKLPNRKAVGIYFHDTLLTLTNTILYNLCHLIHEKYYCFNMHSPILLLIFIEHKLFACQFLIIDYEKKKGD